MPQQLGCVGENTTVLLSRSASAAMGPLAFCMNRGGVCVAERVREAESVRVAEGLRLPVAVALGEPVGESVAVAEAVADSVQPNDGV